ncbi:MAG TPA: hypothetical protein VG407_07565 [Caulobacteraceae bacterium]|jgi:hypothetical protein|nr:hypothetical protein [Caulobacteraceae bacterium]
MSAPAWRAWLADLLMQLAASRLKATHPDWARAMLHERANLPDQDDPLGFAFGCLRASWAATDAVQALYPVALVAGVMAVTGYEWVGDGSVAAVALLVCVGLALGAISPRRSWMSALAVGLAVAAVIGFEAFTGIRPSHEVYEHSLVSAVRWSLLVLPALAATAVGGFAGRWLRA